MMMQNLPRLAVAMFGVSSIASLSACTTTGSAEAAASLKGETAAKAAAFRYIFANNASALKTNAATYCIGNGPAATRSTPNPELLAALSDVRPPVRSISACRGGDRVIDSAGRPALIFTLETIACEGGMSCVFRGGYQEGNVSASSAMYHARIIDGRWQVTQEGPIAVS